MRRGGWEKRRSKSARSRTLVLFCYVDSRGAAELAQFSVVFLRPKRRSRARQPPLCKRLFFFLYVYVEPIVDTEDAIEDPEDLGPPGAKKSKRPEDPIQATESEGESSTSR